MKSLLGKKILAVDEKRENSPFFRIMLDDGSLLNISSSGNVLQFDYITDADEAFELSGGMILDSHNDQGQWRVPASTGPSGYRYFIRTADDAGNPFSRWKS